jgi:predicted Rossmann-fold nucleotide-binding protein
VIIVRSSRVLIAVSGGPGTLSEIAFALQLRVPVVSLKSFSISEQVIQTSTPAHALREALALAEQQAGANHA